MVKKLSLGLMLGLGVTVAAVATASATSSTIPAHKIGICHATGSSSNPYVFIIVDKHAVPAHTGHQDGRDIIGAKSAADCPHATGGQGSVLGAAVTPQPAPTTLPDTGAETGALIGAPALVLAGRSYWRSRRS